MAVPSPSNPGDLITRKEPVLYGYILDRLLVNPVIFSLHTNIPNQILSQLIPNQTITMGAVVSCIQGMLSAIGAGKSSDTLT